jgi:hypothetical protein
MKRNARYQTGLLLRASISVGATGDNGQSQKQDGDEHLGFLVPQNNHCSVELGLHLVSLPNVLGSRSNRLERHDTP